MRLLFAAAAALCFGVPASAEDKTPCGAAMVCASDPQTVMAAMKKAKFAPTLDEDSDGDPMIASKEGVYNFQVYFYGCKAHMGCDSLRFESTFEKAPENTYELANKWNAKKRFLQAYVRPSGEFTVAYDVSTMGGLNQANFTDVLEWWNSQLDELAGFFKEEVPGLKS